MLEKKIHSLLIHNFQHKPTKLQEKSLKILARFVDDIEERGIFLLKGYAGTGKTTLVGSLVKSLLPVGKKSVLLAPTGRAAKVLSVYSKKTAFTIHKKIYWFKSNSYGKTYLSLQENKHTNTIFIVDEASMIPDNSEKGFGGRNLLDDLIEYVYSGVNCKIILIGDTAQLPPVHLDISPALDKKILEKKYSREVIEIELTQVVRQQSDSSILSNATSLRNLISKNSFTYPSIDCNDDVLSLKEGLDIQDALEDSYSLHGVEGTVVVCRSNKRANLYNQQIRARIRFQEDEISVGDFIMVVRNNYHWLPATSKAGFIANGDTAEVLRIYEFNDLYGFRFARILIRLIDFPDMEDLEVVILLDLLQNDAPGITFDEYKKLYSKVENDYVDISKKSERIKQIKNNPFLNALQVKFAYAVTCHKSQGGQWKNVFVEQGFFNEEMLNKEYLRWLYTAFTRATSKLFLINFNDKFFKNSL
jgi:exodeoxyribonuclease-5